MVEDLKNTESISDPACLFLSCSLALRALAADIPLSLSHVASRRPRSAP